MKMWKFVIYKNLVGVSMNENKEQTMNVLVLIKSAKNHELCVAGIDLDTNKLVRLVADGSGKEIKKTDFKMDDKEVQIFDKITIKGTPAPLKIQTENVILNKIDKVEHYDADKAYKAMSSIINNGALLKTNDYAIPHKDILDYDKSLMVVEVSDFETKIIENNEGKSKTKATFLYKKQQYDNISVTDSDYFKEAQKHKKCKIILSIPETQYPKDNVNGKHFKFIAKIFPINDDDKEDKNDK